MAALGYASITVLLLVGGDILTAYSMAAPLIVYCWIAPYVLISLGALVLAKREGLLSTGIVVAAVVGGFGMAWVYLNGWIYPPTSPTDAMVWVAVVIVALAAVGVAVRHRMSGQRRVG
jgi:hypothetical protein